MAVYDRNFLVSRPPFDLLKFPRPFSSYRKCRLLVCFKILYKNENILIYFDEVDAKFYIKYLISEKGNNTYVSAYKV
jgi:hypothetical protein